jgi:ubiquitin-protein ligase
MSGRALMLINNFISAKTAGKKAGFDIAQVDEDSFEEYYILFKPNSGIYRDQSQIISMKTTYGSGVSYQYPFKAPLVKFLTKVHHTNISTEGSICLDILKDGTKWMPTYDFEQIIYNIMLLYMQPNTDSPFNGVASKEYSDCRKVFKSRMYKGIPLDEEDVLEIQCFEPYKQKADNYANSDLTKYAKWFPQIVGKTHSQEYNDNIQSMIDDIQIRKDKKEAAAKARNNKPNKKSRWSKYQKKKPVVEEAAAATVEEAHK